MTTTIGSMLALVPGPTTPGTGANTEPGPPGLPPGIYDPPRIGAAASAFIRARDGYLITREHDDGPPDLLAASSLHPNAYMTWLDHIWAAAACRHPIRLYGDIGRVNPGTGEVLSTTSTAAFPDGVIYKACGNRRATICPGCAETYRRDAYHLIRTGLIGGKGVPQHVATHPAVFATFTAPSFGAVHTRPVRQHTCNSRDRCRCQPAPCHARRTLESCEHGRPQYCFTRHSRNDPVLGQPLCPDCYDHAAHVVWNNNAGELWRRTKQAIERHLGQLARRRGVPPVWTTDSKGRRRGVPPVRVSHGKAAEYQARGAVHFHVLLRLDGFDPEHPGAILPPPAQLTVADLDDAIRQAAATITYTTPPHSARPDGWVIGWGAELDVRVISMRGTGTVTDLMAASYLAKYSTKGTEITGHTSGRITLDTLDLYANPGGSHPERLIHTCWALGRHPDYRSLRRWAHMLGFGGHFLTKARHYSLTFTNLRQARITYRRGQTTGPEHGPIRTADHTEQQTILVVGNLTYTGTGWKNNGDAMLANTAADQARRRREAGHEELAHQHNSTTTGRQAA